MDFKLSKKEIKILENCRDKKTPFKKFFEEPMKEEMTKERIKELRKIRCQDVNRAVVYECLDEIERLQKEKRPGRTVTLRESTWDFYIHHIGETAKDNPIIKHFLRTICLQLVKNPTKGSDL